MTRLLLSTLCAVLALGTAACRSNPDPSGGDTTGGGALRDSLERGLAGYTTVRLTLPLDSLSDHERQMIPLLMQAAEEMDTIYWAQAYGNRDSLLNSLTDADAKRYVTINYGPWDRLDDNRPFLPGVGPKPDGAGFYPADMTKAEFDSAAAKTPALKSLYTLVRRRPDRSLYAVPYHEAYAAPTQHAAALIRQAAALADDPGLKRYLTLRADALLTDNYQASDLAWLDMKNNTLDFVVGPIETYEDALYGYKAAHEAYVLVKDRAWSGRLAHYAALLPALQRGLPVPDAYKRETPGADSDLGAYDVIYYAGQANAGGKTIAVNLPNDEQVQLQKGTRRLQLKNAMRAKFDAILLPIARELLVPEQQPHVTFDAFFATTMFHEVAHGLGIKNTIGGKGTVREALKEQAGRARRRQGRRARALHDPAALLAGRTRRRGHARLLHDLRGVHLPLDPLRRRRRARARQPRRASTSSRRWAPSRATPPATTAWTSRSSTPPPTPSPSASSASRATATTRPCSSSCSSTAQIDETLRADLARLAAKNIPVDVVFEQGPSVLGL